MCTVCPHGIIQALSLQASPARPTKAMAATPLRTLPVNLFCYVLRGIRRGGNQPRRYQRRVHSSFRCEPVHLRRTEWATPPFPKLVSQLCHELVPILSWKICGGLHRLLLVG